MGRPPKVHQGSITLSIAQNEASEWLQVLVLRSGDAEERILGKRLHLHLLRPHHSPHVSLGDRRAAMV